MGKELPEEYLEVAICHRLKITYTELEKQPNWWVEKMVTFIAQREKAKQKLEEKQARQSKGKSRSR